MTAAFLASAAQAADEPPITVLGYPWAPFISPMGEPFRANAVDSDPFARWFHGADGNADGLLTADEMQADAERFFRKLDSDHDGEIGPEEINVYEAEVAQEVQVNTRWKRARGAAGSGPETASEHGRRGKRRAEDGVNGYQPYGLQGAARYGLLNIPEPVAGADADFNRSTTFGEFQRAALVRFQLLDRKKAGHLTLPDLEPLLPTRPKGRKLVRVPEEPRDTRIGLPFPKGD